jgi:hypothetical protein
LRQPLLEADMAPMRPQEVADWLGIPLAEFPLWAVAYLERDLANTGELARAFRNRDDEIRCTGEAARRALRTVAKIDPALVE